MYFGHFHPTLPSSTLSHCGRNSFYPQICLLLSYLCFICDPLLTDWDVFMNMGGVVYCTWYNFPVATPLKIMTPPLPAIVNYQKLVKEGWGSQVPSLSLMEWWSHLVQVFASPFVKEEMVHLVQVLASPVMEWWSHLVQVIAYPICDGGDGPILCRSLPPQSVMEGMVHFVQVLACDQSCFEFRSSITMPPFFFLKNNYLCFSWINLNQISGIIKFYHP